MMNNFFGITATTTKKEYWFFLLLICLSWFLLLLVPYKTPLLKQEFNLVTVFHIFTFSLLFLISLTAPIYLSIRRMIDIGTFYRWHVSLLFIPVVNFIVFLLLIDLESKVKRESKIEDFISGLVELLKMLALYAIYISAIGFIIYLGYKLIKFLILI